MNKKIKIGSLHLQNYKQVITIGVKVRVFLNVSLNVNARGNEAIVRHQVLQRERS